MQTFIEIECSYEIRYLEVWGNAEEGWEVNDMSSIQSTITINDETRDIDLIKELIDREFLSKHFDYTVEDHTDDFIYISRKHDDMPILQLERAGEWE